ncbi:MAG: Hpt domain-containing protein, partial [Gemmatimonadales bacterium]|nr:Hpt domain-containing protein [Gemmatimonadales bacterium]
TQPTKPAKPAKSHGTPIDENNVFFDDEIMGEFLCRQTDVMMELEKHILNLEGESGEESQELLLRVLHTLKGESALLGMTEIAEVCHTVEDMVHHESMVDCVDRLLSVKDWFIDVFKNLAENGPAPSTQVEILASLKSSSEPSGQEPESQPTEVEEPVVESAEAKTDEVETTELESGEAENSPEPVEMPLVEYEVVDFVGKNILEGDTGLLQDFIEEAVEHLDASEGHLLDIETTPEDPEPLNAVFRGFHTIKGLAGFLELDHVKDLAHKAENLLDMARRGDLVLAGPNMDLVFESVDLMKQLVDGMIQAMEGDGLLTGVDNLGNLMGRLVAATDSTAAQTAPEPKAQAEPEPVPEPEPETPAPAKASGFIPLGKMKSKKPASPQASASPAAEIPSPQKTVAAEKPKTPKPLAAKPAAAKPAAESSAGVVPSPSATATQTRAPVKVKEAVRVDAERLDRLIETIGELVIAESMVTHSSEITDLQMSVQLAKNVDHLDKICRELQEIGMSLRMVPVKPVFQKMARLVRDLSKKQNRLVEFVMTGEDTELDKNVVDKIGDPLVHMVRNSVDHGIEPDPADRVKLGKSETGRVSLRAFHKGGNICIEIEDDGRGLNRDAILAKAVDRGLIKKGEKLSDREIFAMVFEAGFSTAKEVTEVSGRGVGMDVVRRNIEELRGTVDIASEVGKGTTFSIKLPLTLAIIEGMVIMVGNEHYIIPTLTVVRLVQPKKDDITHVFDRGEMLAFEGTQLPLFRLSSLFEVEGAKMELEEAVVVVVEEEGKKIGLLADKLIGQQSIVIKSLGETIQGTEGLAGGAIMSDGKVALILDIGGLVKVANSDDMTFPLIGERAKALAEVEELVNETKIEPVSESSLIPVSENEPVEIGI